MYHIDHCQIHNSGPAMLWEFSLVSTSVNQECLLEVSYQSPPGLNFEKHFKIQDTTLAHVVFTYIKLIFK